MALKDRIKIILLILIDWTCFKDLEENFGHIYLPLLIKVHIFWNYKTLFKFQRKGKKKER